MSKFWPNAVLAVWIVIAVCGAMALWPAAHRNVSAQQKVRINPLIEQLEQGKPAISDVDWMFIDMEHSPYLLDRLESTLAGLKRKPNGQLTVAPFGNLYPPSAAIT